MKPILCGMLAVALLLLAGAPPADAWTPHALHRGFHRRGFRHGHRHVFVGGRFFFGGPGWPGPWGPYPYLANPPVMVQQTPPVYIQQPTPGATAYWYYCAQPRAYYPYVKACPGGWMTVVPPTAAPAP